MSDRTYYIVPDDHPIMGQIKAYQQSHIGFQNACRDFAEKHSGRRDFWQTGDCFKGLQFDGEAPPGWGHKQGDPKGCYTPYGKSEAAYALRKEINALPKGMSNWEFESYFGGYHVNQGGIVSFTSFEQVGDKVIVGVPARPKMPVVLEGCIELKMSEYYTLKAAAANVGAA